MKLYLYLSQTFTLTAIPSTKAQLPSFPPPPPPPPPPTVPTFRHLPDPNHARRIHRTLIRLFPLNSTHQKMHLALFSLDT